MTKRDLVVRISNDTAMVQQDVLTIVQRCLDLLVESLAQGETVELRNFGVFEVKIRKARVGRNPNAPATDIRIPPRAVVKFKPGKHLRAMVLKHPVTALGEGARPAEPLRAHPRAPTAR